MQIPNDPAPAERYLTSSLARRYLQRAYGYELQPWTLLRWAKAGKVVAKRQDPAAGGRHAYTREALDSLMDRLRVLPLGRDS